jgi:hypothetical protein
VPCFRNAEISQLKLSALFATAWKLITARNILLEEGMLWQTRRLLERGLFDRKLCWAAGS